MNDSSYRRLFSVFVLVTLISSIVASQSCSSLASKGNVIQEIRLSKDFFARIKTWKNPVSDTTLTVTYDVLRNGRSIIGGDCMLGVCKVDDLSKLQFNRIATPDNMLVGLVENTRPCVVRMVHDFETNWSWPHREFVSSDRAKDFRQTQAILHKIEVHYNGLNLFLEGRNGGFFASEGIGDEGIGDGAKVKQEMGAGLKSEPPAPKP